MYVVVVFSALCCLPRRQADRKSPPFEPRGGFHQDLKPVSVALKRETTYIYTYIYIYIYICIYIYIHTYIHICNVYVDVDVDVDVDVCVYVRYLCLVLLFAVTLGCVMQPADCNHRNRYRIT